jgi:hypothetical protein
MMQGYVLDCVEIMSKNVQEGTEETHQISHEGRCPESDSNAKEKVRKKNCINT